MRLWHNGNNSLVTGRDCLTVGKLLGYGGVVQAYTGTASVANYGGYPNGYAFSPSVPAAQTVLPATTTLPSTTSSTLPATAADQIPSLAAPSTGGTSTYYLSPDGSATTSNSHIPWTTVTPQHGSAPSNTDGSPLSPVPADRRPTIDPQLRDPGDTDQQTGYGNAPLQPIPYLPPRNSDQRPQNSVLRGEYSDLDWLKRDDRRLDRRWEAVPISWNTDNRPPAPRLLPPEEVQEPPLNSGGWESFSR